MESNKPEETKKPVPTETKKTDATHGDKTTDSPCCCGDKKDTDSCC